MYIKVFGNSYLQISIVRLLTVWGFIVIGTVNCQNILQILQFEEEEFSLNNLDKSANVFNEENDNFSDQLQQEPDLEFEVIEEFGQIEVYYELIAVEFETPLVSFINPTPCDLTLASCRFDQRALRYKWNNETQQCVPYIMCNFQDYESKQECEEICIQ